MTDYTNLVNAAREHYTNLSTDINNAKDRVEHIRLTALAQEARNLLNEIEDLAAASAGGPETFIESQEVLDLPDFKSPYNPDA